MPDSDQLSTALLVLKTATNQNDQPLPDTPYWHYIFPVVRRLTEALRRKPHESATYSQQEALSWVLALLTQQEGGIEISNEIKPQLRLLLAEILLIEAANQRNKALHTVASTTANNTTNADTNIGMVAKVSAANLVRERFQLKQTDDIIESIINKVLGENELDEEGKADKFIDEICKKANKKSATWHQENRRRADALSNLLGPITNEESHDVTDDILELTIKVVDEDTLITDEVAKAVGHIGSWAYALAVSGEVSASILEYITDDSRKNSNYFLNFATFGVWDVIAQILALAMTALILKTLGKGYIGRLEGIVQGFFATVLRATQSNLDIRDFCLRVIAIPLAGFASYANSTPVKNAYVRKENPDLFMGLLSYLPDVFQGVVAWTLAALHFVVLGKLYSSAMLGTNFLQLRARYRTPFTSNQQLTAEVIDGANNPVLKRADSINQCILIPTILLTLPSIGFRVLFNASHMYRLETGAEHVPLDAGGNRISIPAQDYVLAALATLVTFTYLVDNSSRLAKGLAALIVGHPNKPFYEFLKLSIIIMASALGLLTLTAFKDHPQLNIWPCIVLNFIGSILYMFSAASGNSMYEASRNSMLETAAAARTNGEVGTQAGRSAQFGIFSDDGRMSTVPFTDTTNNAGQITVQPGV